MEKQTADALIHEYMEKIYGFSVSKAFNLDEAEELCSDIIYEVYASLLKIPKLHNPAGYIWRTSQNVYSRYIISKKRDAHTPLEDVVIPVYDEYGDKDAEIQSEYALLRREITYLTKIRRKIIVLFYFEKLKITEIAAKTNLPEGTVKWHLSRARDELKEGMKMERTIGKLGLSPIRFTEIGHNGCPGKLGGPEIFISGLIEQNILYSIYAQPKSTAEISDDLGISLVYLEDIIKKLEENGFIIKADPTRYTTYVQIAPRTYSLKKQETMYKMREEIARLLQKEYAPLVKKAVDSLTEKHVYIPGGNRSLLYATMLTFGIMCNNLPFGKEVDTSKYFICPTDGGRYTVYAEVAQERNDPGYVSTIEQKSYPCCGPMTRQSCKYSISSWSIDSLLDSRNGTWQENKNDDYDYLYEYIIGKLPHGPENAEKYQRLYDRKYISEDGQVQVIVANLSSNIVPEIPAELKEKLAIYTGKSYELYKNDYPPQIQDLIKNNSRYVLTPSIAMMVLDFMTEDGELPAFTENQKITLNLIVFSDKLPE